MKPYHRTAMTDEEIAFIQEQRMQAHLQAEARELRESQERKEAFVAHNGPDWKAWRRISPEESQRSRCVHPKPRPHRSFR